MDNKLEQLKTLNSEIENINKLQEDENITVREYNRYNDDREQLVKEFGSIAHVVYFKFRLFCRDNQELYKNWLVMERSTDEIIKMKLKPSKNAVMILLENQFDNCGDRNVVLVPYEFIESPDLYLDTRRKYINKKEKQLIVSKIEYKRDLINGLDKEIISLYKQLDNWEL